MSKISTVISEPVAKILKKGTFAFLGTVMKDGSPHVTPTWVDIENGTILVNTAIGRTKQKNISRDGRVALAIADQSNPYDMVTVRGKVVQQITGPVAEEHIDKLAKKYMGKDKYPGRGPGEKRILLKIKPEKVSHMKQ